MRRSFALAPLVLSAVAGGGCQSYNFSPMAPCLIHPGSRQVTLASASVADVLFVVDDSGSTEPKQQALAQSFASFIQEVAVAQKDRVSRGLRPFEFHVAVTTSSVFRDYSVGNTGFSTRFENLLNPGCTQGVAVAGGQYPQGGFVAAGTNARVLHFTANLNWASWGTATPDPAIVSLVRQFVGTSSGGVYSGGNVEVGSCGSGEEQHMEAARLALAKALAGQQPGISASEFPHVGAKLVVVFVGDEDDCSSSPVRPLLLTGDPGNDSCVADEYLPAADRKLFAVSEFASYLSGLVAPSGRSPSVSQPYVTMGAAFIVSSVECADGTYVPADACTPVGPPVASGVCPYAPTCSQTTQPTVCGGAYSAGVRFFELADLVRGGGFDVVQASVCEPFGPTLAAIADLVKAPVAIRLPSQPAAREISVLRILGAGGEHVKICTQATSAGASSTAGWWFADCADRGNPPAVAAAPTECIYINHASGDCEANPGETYSAEFLGQLPEGGCASATSDGTTPSSECAGQLGGDASRWSCFRPADIATGNGTCICR